MCLKFRRPLVAGLLQFVDVVDGELDAADERLAFAHPMAIRAAGDEQAVLLRDVQIVRGDVGRMLGVVALDDVESSFD